MSQQQPSRAEMRAEQHEQMNLTQAQQQTPGYGERREYLDRVIEDELDDATVGMLRNMTSADFILSNFNDAEINEVKKLREITYKKVVAAHPSQRTAMRGERRTVVYEDGKKLRPLDANQKVLIDQYIRGAFARLVRSREGFQQEQLGKTISESVTHTDSGSDDGGLLPW
jgi:hypothetical protein